MCMHWMACLCWRDTKSPSVAIGVFALVTSLIQIALSIAVFTTMSVDMKMVTNPLYITLACMDFVVVILSILLLIGFERADGCHHWARFSWVIWIFIYILYESAINIFLFVQVFNNNALQGLKAAVIVFIVYWSIKEVILFIGWLFILSHLCYGDSLAVNYSDAPVQVVTGEAIRTTNNYGGVHPQTYVSNFDIVRPTSGCKVYCSNGGCGGGNPAYLGPTRYM